MAELDESSQGNDIGTTKSENTLKLDKGLRSISSEVMKSIVNLSTGDARTALSLLELVLNSPSKTSDAAIISHLRRSVSSRYDRSGEDRYDMISALHKSIRGSSGDGALYWLARLGKVHIYKKFTYAVVECSPLERIRSTLLVV